VKFEQSAEKNHMKTIPIATSIAALAMTAAIAETRSSEYFVVFGIRRQKHAWTRTKIRRLKP
jgi:hypothetical protein